MANRIDPGDDLWRECAAWLTRCQVIPKDHKANWPESQIQTLAKTLRDGVLLCNLMNFLDPGTLDNFNRKPQLAQFLCCQNIKQFQEAARANFGLHEADIFDPMMLFNLTDFHKVLVCLSKLSRSSRAAQLHPTIQGFNVYIPTGDCSQSEEDIYKDLHSTTSHQPSYARGRAIDDEDDIHDNSKEEEVYQALCSTHRSNRPQFTTSTSKQRDYVIQELLDTETNYLDVLKALRDKFMGALEPLLSPDDLRQIFPCIRQLCTIHESFLQRLHESQATPPRCQLSAPFLDFREKFLVYGEYCSNMTAAMDKLRHTIKCNAQVDQVIQQCQKEHSDGRSQLRDILSVPMQRILKYHLLLDKLVEKTTPNHEDFRGLERSKEAMVDVAHYTNEVKRDSEHLSVIEKVRLSIADLNLSNGNDLKQYGRLLQDGDIYIKAHDDQKMKHRYAFLFEKLLILLKVANSRQHETQYSFRVALNLTEYRVESMHSRRTLGRDARYKYQLVLARLSQSTAYTLYMRTETERDKWTLNLQEAMDTLKPVGSRASDHNFAVQTYERAVVCFHCSKFLKGLLHQGYRCGTCDINVHKQCIIVVSPCRHSQTVAVASVSLAPPPVCDRQLVEFYWFVGQMERDVAQARLINRKVGTYLLRVRPTGASNGTETMYALSLKTDERTVKHMKISQKQEGDHMLYCLSTRRHFRTIVELVSFYERNDLGENFAGLNQSLQWPFTELIAVAKFDFNPTEPNQLPLRVGVEVLVIGKEGDSKGWWRGKTPDRVGFFPKEYVQLKVDQLE